jgi:hypothetical protein
VSTEADERERARAICVRVLTASGYWVVPDLSEAEADAAGHVTEQAVAVVLNAIDEATADLARELQETRSALLRANERLSKR